MSTSPPKAVLFSLLLLVTSVGAIAGDLEHREITLWSQGVRLAGDIYQPGGLKEADKLPGILLVGGWGGSKENLKLAYASRFAQLGFVVLIFDFKGWGESNGPLWMSASLPTAEETREVSVKPQHVRLVVDPQSMIEDARAALHYLVGEKNVDPDNIGVWGTSLGGGLALVTAANDSRVKAFVTQVGAVDNKANFAMITAAQASKWETQRARGEIPSYPGPESKTGKLRGYADYIALMRYDPAAYWDLINVPTLVIDAQDEELFDRNVNGKALYERLKERTTADYLVLPGKHYAIYRDEGYKQALKAAQDWFVAHLKQGVK